MRSITRESRLRFALLTALGLPALACGGVTQREQEEPSGGSASQGGSTAQGGSGNIAGTSQKTCTSPVTDPLTGLVSCTEGYAHRPIAKQCGLAAQTIAPPGGLPAPAPLPRADGSVQCDFNSSADACAGFLFGYCRTQAQGGGPISPSCYSGCVSDTDCGPNEACLCDEPKSPTGGACRAVGCRTDAECLGSLCASAVTTCGDRELACQTARDRCLVDTDCFSGRCVYGETMDEVPLRSCGGQIACGRPFLVERAPRLAPVIGDGTWAAAGREERGASPQLVGLTAAERAALAEHWTRMGQMEHASIAAFARFSLQLLALGAPPELVSACTRALGDETAHTQLCFQLASAYAGRSIGPGPLDVSGSLEVTSLADIVDLVIAEGCFGETVAALDALEAADNARDPVVAAAYTQIGRDEQRHAELAFRFLRWAMERDSHMVRRRVTSALDACFDSAGAARDVVVPCLQALLHAKAQLSEATA